MIKYLTSIFKILRFPTSNFIFNYNVNNYLFIYSDILIPSLFFLNKKSIFFKKKYYFLFKYFKYYKKNKLIIFNIKNNIYNYNTNYFYIVYNQNLIFFEISYSINTLDENNIFYISVSDFILEYNNYYINNYYLFYYFSFITFFFNYLNWSFFF